MNKQNILAIIPARGGSKGLPGKNIRPLLNHPLIAYSILAAKESRFVNRCIVSTDSSEIANIAKQNGAEIPFMRPAEFAQDASTDLDVFKHVLSELQEKENYIPEYIVQLRPTSPVRPKGIIDKCIELLMSSQADSLRVVTEAPITPYKMWRIDSPEEPMKPLLTLSGVFEPFNQPRQKLPKVYWQIGTLDIIKTSVIIEQQSMSGEKILPYIIDKAYAVDIDDLSSFEKAEQTITSLEDCTKFEN